MIIIEYKLTGIEMLTRSQVINAVKRAFQRTGEYWHEAFAWKRFTPIAYSEYGFMPRTLRYNKRKGHNDPLYYKGTAAEELLSESTKARITTTRDTIRIPMPTKLNRYNPKGPVLSDEVRKVSRAELNVLQENLVILIEDELTNELPASQRNKGFSGGQVQSLSLRNFRSRHNANPVEHRKAA